MKIYVLTLFPEMIAQAFSHSILGRAQKEGLLSIEAVNIRDFSQNKHNRVDDYPYGGGAGMVMAAPPIVRCHQFVQEKCQNPQGARTLYMSPQGKVFNQSLAEEFSKEQELILICGHYEGIDERAILLTQAEEISVGDYILTGGEIAAIAIIDATARLVDGVLGKAESYMDESFSEGLLEYPQYTRPAEFMGEQVPEVLLSGNHKAIADWRESQSRLRTAQKRSDLLTGDESGTFIAGK